MRSQATNSAVDRMTALDGGVHRLIVRGTVVLAGLFGGLVLWSVAVPIESAVVAPGLVQVSGSNKVIQHLEGGIIDEILVADGDRVEVGQPLVRLDTSEVIANLASIDARLFTLAGEEARLIAERDKLDELPQTDTLQLLETLDEARTRRTLLAQEAIYKTRADAVETDEKLLMYKIQQQRERVEGLQDLITSNNEQIAILEDEIVGLETLYEKGHVPKSRMLALKREKERLNGQQAGYRAEIAQIRTSIAEGELQIFRLKNEEREGVLSELKEVSLTIQDLRERRQYAVDRLERTEITAPYAGDIMGVNVHAINGVVSPGSPLMHIVPDGEDLVVIARIRPADISRVEVGDPVRVRLQNQNSSTTPEVDGTLATVSADILVEQDSVAPYYRAVIQLDQEALERSGNQLSPGMPASALIHTGNRTAISYLTKPMTDFMSVSMKEE